MKLLDLLKTTLKPDYDRKAETISHESAEVQRLEKQWSRRRTAVSESSGQARRQSEALKGLLNRADAIGSSSR